MLLRLLLVLALSSWSVVSAQHPQGHGVSFYFRSCSLSGRLANGMCCDTNATENCPAHCDVHFVVCVREHNETSNFCNSTTSSHVTFLHYAYLNVRDLTFFEGDNVFGVGLHNPLVYSFSGNWSKRIQTVLIARDFDFDFSFTNIDYIDVNWTVPAGREVDNRTFNGTYNNMVVNVGLKVECWEGWYGEYCTVFCVPRDDSSGHYGCTDEGEKRCLEGWTGVHCRTGICIPSCPSHAACSNVTRTCECENGFMEVAERCECVTRMGCDHTGGFCQVPGDCHCKTGYNGTDCGVRDWCMLNGNPCMHSSTCAPTGNNTYDCVCTPGHRGQYCELRACQTPDVLCLNGTCADTSTDIRCSCESGFTGRYCEMQVDFCLSNPCAHGTCDNMIGDYTCDCESGYTGKDCHHAINECDQLMPCEHGTCVDRIASYVCICNPSYMGQNCTEPCTNTSLCNCESNCVFGSCVASGGICQCESGYTGSDCSSNTDDCQGACENGANCTDGLNAFNCHCPDGFTGTTCAGDVDECATGLHMCQNGMCVNTPGSYTCSCDTGYSDQLCDTFVQLDYCATHDPCLNGSSCLNEMFTTMCMCANGFGGANCSESINSCATISCAYLAVCEDGSCVCPPFLTGPRCDAPVDVCEVSREPGDCGNGECINDLDSAAGYRCACDTGYTGETCRDDIDDCASAPCSYGGNCTDSLDAFICDCERGYYGERCENVINLCDANTCLNGGTCVPQNGAQSCKCATGYVEPLCEKIEDCGRDSCYQKGECKGVSKDLKQAVCVCDPGYTGAFCEQLINYCTSSPCTTGATCYQGVDSYYCRCENGVPGCVEQGEAAISTNSIIPGVENSVTGLLGGVSLGVVLTLLGCILVAFLLGLLHLRARKKRQRRRNDDTRRISLNPLLISEQGDPLFGGTENFPMMEPPAYNSLIGDTSKDTFKTAIISEKHEVFENKIPL